MKLKFYFDEAGRGPLAGPVLVGCILPIDNFDNSLFKDSKKLTEKKRLEIFDKIQELEKDNKLFFSYGFASNIEIDKFGISKSINLATKRALLIIILKYIYFLEENIDYDGTKFFSIQKIKQEIDNLYKNDEKIYNYDFSILIKIFQELEKIHGIIFDGNIDFGLSKDLGFKVISIIKGDDKVPYIGGASIVAKVVRDNYIINQSKKYPEYGFEKHKGYGTKLHRENIKKYGISNFHRKTFCRNIVENDL